MLGAAWLKRCKLLVYSKPLFRSCDVLCNYASRSLLNPDMLTKPALRERLAEINTERIRLQLDLSQVGAADINACAQCQGKCCYEPRRRDSLHDRILNDPGTRNLRGRPEKVCEPNNGHCPELTEQGCRLPYELRPVQCTAYFCRPAIRGLSNEQCDAAARALAGLVKLQFRVARLVVLCKLGGLGSEGQKAKKSKSPRTRA